MVGAEEEDQPPPRVFEAVENGAENIVSTGETSALDDYEDIFSATDEEADDREVHKSNGKQTARTNDNLFYDDNLDEEDETYVYKHMRGGIREIVTISKTSHNGHSPDCTNVKGNTLQQQTVEVFKPRESDAVLSCPCCFNIVCMDCQKHKRYANQYRAMFVMGVVVDWKHVLVYDEKARALVSKIENGAIEDESSFSGELIGASYGDIQRTKRGEYFAVKCASCRTQVAALDMAEEVYYFHGCLESSAAF